MSLAGLGSLAIRPWNLRLCSRRTKPTFICVVIRSTAAFVSPEHKRSGPRICSQLMSPAPPSLKYQPVVPCLVIRSCRTSRGVGEIVLVSRLWTILSDGRPCVNKYLNACFTEEFVLPATLQLIILLKRSHADTVPLGRAAVRMRGRFLRSHATNDRTTIPWNQDTIV